jgi:uncharacterized damage-inducible protein DinB
MKYSNPAIPESAVPRAADPVFQHVVDTYASETNKLISTWREFGDSDLSFRAHSKSTTVEENFKHQLLSERRFFSEFIGAPAPLASEVLPAQSTVDAFCTRMRELAEPRLAFLANQDAAWWLEERLFFDTARQRIWIFWRRVLHTAHHRTQLAVYLRLLDRPVPAIYGPTADVTWTGADPTNTLEAAGRQ